MKHVKSVEELSKVIKRGRRHVLTLCEPLVANHVVAEFRDGGRVVGYGPLSDLKGCKKAILAWHRKKKKPPTKWNPGGSPAASFTIRVKQGLGIRPRVSLVTIDDIDSFAKVKKFEPPIQLLQPARLPETRFKHGLRKILGEYGKFQDWGGENNDLSSGHLKIKGKRFEAAFALKGPAKKGPLTPAKMGKNGDQIQRLFSSRTASVFFVQYEGEIADSVREQMKVFAQAAAILSTIPVRWGVIGMVDSHRLRMAYPNAFKPR